MTKRLYKDFAKVVLPGYVQSKAYPNAFLSNTEEYSPVYLDQWQTVIELAQGWCDSQKAQMAIHYYPKDIGDKEVETKWLVDIRPIFHDIRIQFKSGYNKSLPIAIMRAVVEAARGK